MGEVLESILVLVKSTDVKDKHKGVTELIDFFQQEPKKLTVFCSFFFFPQSITFFV